MQSYNSDQDWSHMPFRWVCHDMAHLLLLFFTFLFYEPRHEKTCLLGYLIRSDINWAVQQQNRARGLKFRIQEVDGLYNICSAVTAQLICTFVFA